VVILTNPFRPQVSTLHKGLNPTWKRMSIAPDFLFDQSLGRPAHAFSVRPIVEFVPDAKRPVLNFSIPDDPSVNGDRRIA
jgi:hypothetical protein